MTLAGDRSLEQRIEEEFIEALHRCPRLHEESSRQLIVDGIGRHLGHALSLRKQTTVRMEIVELVRVCAGLQRGIELLVEQVEVVEPMTTVLPTLHHLSDEWQAARTLTNDTWAELRRMLAPRRLTAGDEPTERRALRRLAAYATEGRMQEPPRHCTSLWQLFVYLVSVNAGPSGLPPCLAMLKWLAERIPDPALATAMRRSCRELATKWQLVDVLDVSDRRPAAHQPSSGPVYLLIQVDPDPMDGGQLVLSHWREWDPQEWRPVRGEDRTISSRALEAEVDRLIEELETMLGASADTATRTGDIVLEFVLPSDMLNFPVQHLKKKALAGETVPLAIDHPVVIRSLDRLRAPRFHLAWRHRWALADKQVRPYWSQPGGADYFERLAAALRSDPQVFCLILSEPPAPANHTAHLEIAAALRAGIPAIVWHRQDCGSGDFRDAVTTIVSDGALAQLPRRVADLRLDALRLGSAVPDHPGWEIALLWDDPNRLLEPPRGVG